MGKKLLRVTLHRPNPGSLDWNSGIYWLRNPKNRYVSIEELLHNCKIATSPWPYSKMFGYTELNKETKHGQAVARIIRTR